MRTGKDRGTGEPLLADVRCALCGHPSLQPFGMAPAIGPALHPAQWRCPACDLLVSYPLASRATMAGYYQAVYYQTRWSDAETLLRITSASNRVEMGMLARLTAGRRGPRDGRALDVGCGYGGTLDLLRDAGFDVEGCEMSPRAASFCRQRGFRMTRALAPGLPYPSNRYSLVFSTHVIEHVSDPAGFVADLVRVAAPGGAVLVVTDHRWTAQYAWERLRARALGRVPPFHTSTDHSFVFAPHHLQQLLARAGCDDIRVLAYSHRPARESLHWRLYKGLFRSIDRLLGWGEYMMAVGYKPASGAGAAGAAALR